MGKARIKQLMSVWENGRNMTARLNKYKTLELFFFSFGLFTVKGSI